MIKPTKKVLRARGAGRDPREGAPPRRGHPLTPVSVRFRREAGTLGEGELTVSLRIQNSEAAAEAVSARLPGGTDFSGCFNPDYLADASVTSTAVGFCFNGPPKPTVVRAHGAHRNANPNADPNATQGSPPPTSSP